MTNVRVNSWPRLSKALLNALFLVGVAAFVWSQLPKGGYSTELDRIGAGRATVVLAHDANFTGGTAVMDLLTQIRSDYVQQVEFLVAHLGTSEGQEFGRRHGAQDGTVVLFAGDGSPIAMLHHPKSVGELRAALKQAFGV